MVRLWIHPDGRVSETVYAREDAETVARENAKLAALFPDATFEDYSNDAYEALVPKDGSSIGRWRRKGNAIIVLPDVPDARTTAKTKLAAATTVEQLRDALVKLL